jgi:hypothetical protein
MLKTLDQIQVVLEVVVVEDRYDIHYLSIQQLVQCLCQTLVFIFHSVFPKAMSSSCLLDHSAKGRKLSRSKPMKIKSGVYLISNGILYK